MKKTMRFISTLAIASSLALVGCGGGAASTAASEATSAAASEATAVASAVEEATLEETAARGATTEGAIWSEDGVDIRALEVCLVGSTFNFNVTFANNNDMDVDFDYSRFTIVKGDETIQPSTSVKTLDANQSYIQWAIPIQKPGSLALGDEIVVNIDGNLLLETTVVEF